MHNRAENGAGPMFKQDGLLAFGCGMDFTLKSERCVHAAFCSAGTRKSRASPQGSSHRCRLVAHHERDSGLADIEALGVRLGQQGLPPLPR